MRRRTNKSGEGLRNMTATGLVPLLLLASLPGCTARHLPDWSTVQAVKSGTKTEVQLYEDGVLLGHGEKIKGRIRSATDESITLDLKDRMEPLILNKSSVRKVSTHRRIWDRPAGWATLFSTSAYLVVLDGSPGHYVGRSGFLLFSVLPALLAFLVADKKRIYEIPPQHRDSLWTTGPATVKAEEPNDSK